MPVIINNLLEQYMEKIKKIYVKHLKSVILYGSYTRGDYRPDSDIDIMILVDLPDMEIEDYRHQLSGMTYYDFNEEYSIDIKLITKCDTYFKKWLYAYPFLYKCP